MPRYAYRAIDAEGAFSRGALQAANENELFSHLRAQGLNLVDCRIDRPIFARHATKPLPLAEQSLFFRHMLALARAGVPVHVALDDIAPSLPPRLRGTAHMLRDDILAGLSLSAAFERQGKAFDALCPLLLHGGEKTGKLTQALQFLEETLRWKHDILHSLRQQMTYPLVQVVLASAAMLVLMLVAVPQITALLEMMSTGTPLYASIFLALMKIAGFAIVSGAGLLIFGAMLYPLLQSLGGGAKKIADYTLLKLPVLGPLLLKMALARMTHVFAALLGSGVGMMEALTILPQTEKNAALSHQLEDIKNNVGKGEPLSRAFTKKSLVPPYVIRLLRVGEDGGKLHETLLFISSIYQREAQESAAHLIKIIVLFITIGVGLVLIFMVGGALVPLYHGLGEFLG